MPNRSDRSRSDRSGWPGHGHLPPLGPLAVAHRRRQAHPRYRWHDPASSQPRPEPRPKTPALRSYRQIARILAERDGTAITQALVRRMCQAAERTIARALLADPVIRERFFPGVSATLFLREGELP